MELYDFRKVLLLVAELHVRGYQRLRIAPGMAPSGCHWRCAIAPASHMSADNGALICEWEDGLAAGYTSANDYDYFELGEGQHLTPSQLAVRFIDRYPKLTAAGLGRDWLYVGWYQEMLSLTYPDLLPIAYADLDWGLPDGVIGTVGARADVIIPLPPPGEAA